MKTHHFYHLKQQMGKSIPVIQKPWKLVYTHRGFWAQWPKGTTRSGVYSPLELQLETDAKKFQSFSSCHALLIWLRLPMESGDWSRSSALRGIHTRGYMPSPTLFPTTELGLESFSPSWPFLPSFFTWSGCLTNYIPVFAALSSTEQGSHVNDGSKILSPHLRNS